MNHSDPLARLLIALHFAAEKHRRQRRKDVERSPYLNHVIEVAHLLATTGGVSDPELLQAAVLHDTIEDTDTTAEELASIFGATVCSLVQEVTDDKGVPKAERKRLQIEHAAALSGPAKQLKIADKISNIRDLGRGLPRQWSLQRCLEYIDWGQQVVRGCRGTNPPLEAAFDEVVAESRRALLEFSDVE